MVLKDSAGHLELTFNFNIEGFNYVVFVTSITMKRFGCGAEGHLHRACPRGRGENAGAPGAGPPVGGDGAMAPEQVVGVRPLTSSDGALEPKEGLGLEVLGDGAEVSVLSLGLLWVSPEQQGGKQRMCNIEVDQTVMGNVRGKEKNS